MHILKVWTEYETLMILCWELKVPATNGAVLLDCVTSLELAEVDMVG
jgi:hypothetical protein